MKVEYKNEACVGLTYQQASVSIQDNFWYK